MSLERLDSLLYTFPDPASSDRNKVLGVIDEEMRLYPTEPELMIAVSGLKALYIYKIGAPIAKSFLHHACMADAAFKLAGRRENDTARLTPDEDFLAGEIMALHVHTKAASPGFRQHIFKQYSVFDGESDDPFVANGRIAEVFLASTDHPTEDVLTYYHPELAKKVVEIALLYDGSVSGEARDLFLGGYLHANNWMTNLVILKPYVSKTR